MDLLAYFGLFSLLSPYHDNELRALGILNRICVTSIAHFNEYVVIPFILCFCVLFMCM